MRIESDNNGVSSGNLYPGFSEVDVSPASLSGIVYERPVGSQTPTDGDVYHVVLYQGTYGSETIDPTNYYQVAVESRKTNTRNILRWNGTEYTDYVFLADASTSFSVYSGTATGITDSVGGKFYAKNTFYITRVGLRYSSYLGTPTRWIIRDQTGTIVRTGDFSSAS